jgi:hypothetical protein
MQRYDRTFVYIILQIPRCFHYFNPYVYRELKMYNEIIIYILHCMGSW